MITNLVVLYSCFSLSIIYQKYRSQNDIGNYLRLYVTLTGGGLKLRNSIPCLATASPSTTQTVNFVGYSYNFYKGHCNKNLQHIMVLVVSGIASEGIDD